MASNYTGENIKVLDNMTAIRNRAAMYIGSTDKVPGVLSAVDILYKECIDNSVDEFLNGYLNESIIIEYVKDENKLIVRDSGRGLPTDIHPKFKIPTMEVLLTMTHSGGKFDKNSFKVSAGLNGVGIKCVNALSKYLKVTSTRDGYDYTMEFEKGKKVSDLKKTKTKNKFKSGTTFEFIPDDSVFEDSSLDMDLIEEDLKNRAYVNAGLKILYKNGDTTKTYFNENGIKDYIEILNRHPICPTLYYNFSDNGNEYEVVMNYQNTDDEIIKSFVNGIKVTGVCETGFKQSLTSCFTSYINTNNMIPKKLGNIEIKGEDIRMGLVCLINIRHANPHYSNQTKDSINNSDVLSCVKKETNRVVAEWLKNNNETSKKLCNRIIAFSKGRDEANKYKDKVISVNNGSASLHFSSKLKDCTGNDPSKNEIFLVEGDSASGNINYSRIPEFQACYRLRGKVLNSYNMANVRLLQNQEFNELIKIIFGTNDMKNINYDKVRYHKIIITADADTDGSHIQSLLALFFWEHFPELYKRGYIYVCLTPKYRTYINGKFIYFKNDHELNKFITDNAVKSLSLSIGGENVDDDTFEMVIDSSNDYIEKYNDIKNRYAVDDEFMYIIINDSNSLDTLKKISPKELKYDSKLDTFTGMYHSVWHNVIYSDILNDIDTELKPILDTEWDTIDIYDKNGQFVKNADLYNTIMYIKETNNFKLDYFKGLGESDAKELFDTSLDPKKRDLLQIKANNIDDIKQVMYELFGDKTEYRKNFILKNLS